MLFCRFDHAERRHAGEGEGEGEGGNFSGCAVFNRCGVRLVGLGVGGLLCDRTRRLGGVINPPAAGWMEWLWKDCDATLGGEGEGTNERTHGDLF